MVVDGASTAALPFDPTAVDLFRKARSTFVQRPERAEFLAVDAGPIVGHFEVSNGPEVGQLSNLPIMSILSLRGIEGSSMRPLNCIFTVTYGCFERSAAGLEQSLRKGCPRFLQRLRTNDRRCGAMVWRSQRTRENDDGVLEKTFYVGLLEAR